MNSTEQKIEELPWARSAAAGGPEWILSACVFLAAVIGRLPVLGSYWNQSDWGFLGHAAGFDTTSVANGIGARIISQRLWWDIMWPLFGLNPDPQTWARLLLHGGCAILVTRLGLRAGLTPLARLVAGLLFAISPLAFTPLYWATGIQELLAAFFSLLAIDLWMSGRRRYLVLSFLSCIIAMLSHEFALGLPFLFTIFLALNLGPKPDERPIGWALTLLMLLAAVAELALVATDTSSGTGIYSSSFSFVEVIRSLGTFGWWMISPAPLALAEMRWPMIAGGGLLFVLWGTWATYQWRQKLWLPALGLVACLLTLLPALAMEQISPHLAYLAVAAGTLSLASGLPRKTQLSATMLLLMTLLLTVSSYVNIERLISTRSADGLPAEELVRATAQSHKFARMLPALPLRDNGIARYTLNIMQPPKTAAQVENAARFGDHWVNNEGYYKILDGTTAASLLLGKDIQIFWVNGLVKSPKDALVICESKTGFKHWGLTPNALIYAALTDVGRGNFERARQHFIRAGALNEKTVPFSWDADQMIIPLEMVLNNRRKFVDWTLALLNQGHSGFEVGGLQDMFFNALSNCTGLSVEELSEGSTIVIRKTVNEAHPTEQMTSEPTTGEQITNEPTDQTGDK